MWCEHCQSDVPGIATVSAADMAEVCCARCGEILVTKVLRPTSAAHGIDVADHGIDLSTTTRREEPPQGLRDSTETAVRRESPASPESKTSAPWDAAAVHRQPPASENLRNKSIDPLPWGDQDDQWLEQQLAEAGVATSRTPGPGTPAAPSNSDYQSELHRIEPAHASLGGWHPAQAVRQPTPPPAFAPTITAAPQADVAPAQSPQRASSLAWFTLAIGTAAFVCGGVLMGWSFVDGYTHLWNLGMPIMLAGQLGLLVALVLQLERLWRDNRQASQRLETVDHRLDDLRQATRLLSTPHGSASQAFYAHLSEGASPQLLLGDLKGQIDLLAMRLAEAKTK